MIHVSFEWDSRDPDYGTPSSSVFDDGGSVQSEDGRTDDNAINDGRGTADGDGDAVDEYCASRTPSSEARDGDGRMSSHSTLSIYSDHHDIYAPPFVQ